MHECSSFERDTDPHRKSARALSIGNQSDVIVCISIPYVQRTKKKVKRKDLILIRFVYTCVGKGARICARGRVPRAYEKSFFETRALSCFMNRVNALKCIRRVRAKQPAKGGFSRWKAETQSMKFITQNVHLEMKSSLRDMMASKNSN